MRLNRSSLRSLLHVVVASASARVVASAVLFAVLPLLASSADAQPAPRLSWHQSAPAFGDASIRYLYEASYGGGPFEQVTGIECDGVTSPFACSGDLTSALRPVHVRAVDVIDTVRYESAETSSAEEQIPPPTGPVTFCGTQATPTADSYRYQVGTVTSAPGASPLVVTWDNAEADLTLVAPVAACPAGQTHSFALPASLFPIGRRAVRIMSVNAIGSTPGPAYLVVVGIAPGQFTITAVIPPPGE